MGGGAYVAISINQLNGLRSSVCLLFFLLSQPVNDDDEDIDEEAPIGDTDVTAT